jgi:hypothetical protein
MLGFDTFDICLDLSSFLAKVLGKLQDITIKIFEAKDQDPRWDIVFKIIVDEKD